MTHFAGSHNGSKAYGLPTDNQLAKLYSWQLPMCQGIPSNSVKFAKPNHVAKTRRFGKKAYFSVPSLRLHCGLIRSKINFEYPEMEHRLRE